MATLVQPEVWPRGLMRETAMTWGPRGFATVSEATIGGIVQSSDWLGGPLWSLRLDGLKVAGTAIVAAYTAMLDRLGGPRTPVLVPYLMNRDHQPWPTIDGVVVRSLQALFSDRATYDDGAMSSQRVIVVTATAAVAARAMRFRVTPTRAGTLAEGQAFSIDHAAIGRRLYRITRVHLIFGEATDVEIEIHRPLYKALAAGEALDFDDPGCVMRLTSDVAPTMVLRRYGELAVDFLEAF